jgi:streptogramin lyase
MNRDLDTIRLPEPVERYFREVATMQPPADLMDDVLERIEASASPRPNFLSFAPLAAAALAITVMGAGVWALASSGPSDAGTVVDPVASPTARPSPSPIRIAPSPNIQELPRVVEETHRLGSVDHYPMLAYGHGTLWMYDWGANELVRYDPASGAEQTRIDLGPPGGQRLDERDAAVVVTPDAVYAAAAGDLIVRVDPATNEFTELASGVPVTALAADAGTLWALDYRRDEVVRYDLDSRSETARIGLSGGPAHLVLDGDVAWVLTRDGMLVSIDATSNDITGEYPVGPNGSFLSVSGDSVYISGQFRPLARFSISEERVAVHGALLGQVRHVHGHLVGLDRAGHVAFLDPETLEWTGVMEIQPFSVATMVETEDGIWIDHASDEPGGRNVVFARLAD